MQYSVATNSSSLSLSESFNMTVGPVMSLAASPDGTLLYVLTANKVMLLFIAATYILYHNNIESVAISIL